MCIRDRLERMRLLALMPEPAGPDRHVDFRRGENKALRIQDVRHRADLPVRVVHVAERAGVRHRAGTGLHLAVETKLARHDRPLRVARHAGLVAAPARVGAEIVEDYGVRLVFADHLEVAREVVHLLFAALAFAAGVVEPDAEDVAVARDCLLYTSGKDAEADKAARNDADQQEGLDELAEHREHRLRRCACGTGHLAVGTSHRPAGHLRRVVFIDILFVEHDEPPETILVHARRACIFLPVFADTMHSRKSLKAIWKGRFEMKIERCG